MSVERVDLWGQIHLDIGSDSRGFGSNATSLAMKPMGSAVAIFLRIHSFGIDQTQHTDLSV
jgi:hypothetical protein